MAIDEKRLIEDIEKEFEGVCVYDVTASTAIRDFVEIVDKQPKVGEWIPVEKADPEKDEWILLQYDDDENTMCVGWFSKEYGVYRSFDDRQGIIEDVIAWMPLPQAYKGE